MHISFDIFAYFSVLTLLTTSRSSQKNTATIGYNHRKMIACAYYWVVQEKMVLDVDTEMLRSIRTTSLFYQSATICYFISVLIFLHRNLNLYRRQREDYGDASLCHPIYKLYTMNTIVIYISVIYISLPFTIFYDIRCSQFYLWIRARICFSNKLQHPIYHLIIVSTFYFISKRKHRQNVFNNGYSRSR